MSSASLHFHFQCPLAYFVWFRYETKHWFYLCRSSDDSRYSLHVGSTGVCRRVAIAAWRPPAVIISDSGHGADYRRLYGLLTPAYAPPQARPGPIYVSVWPAADHSWHDLVPFADLCSGQLGTFITLRGIDGRTRRNQAVARIADHILPHSRLHSN